MPWLVRTLVEWFPYGLTCTSVWVRLLTVFLGLVSRVKQAWRAIHITNGHKDHMWPITDSAIWLPSPFPIYLFTVQSKCKRGSVVHTIYP